MRQSFIQKIFQKGHIGTGWGKGGVYVSVRGVKKWWMTLDRGFQGGTTYWCTESGNIESRFSRGTTGVLHKVGRGNIESIQVPCDKGVVSYLESVSVTELMRVDLTHYHHGDWNSQHQQNEGEYQRCRG